MDELNKAYEALEVLKALGLPVSSEQLKGLEELEKEHVSKNIIPALKKTLQPLARKLQNPFSILVRINPGEELEIRMAKVVKQEEAHAAPTTAATSFSAKGGVRQGRSLVKVVFPNGKEICHTQVWRTLVDVVKYADPQRVRKLGIMKMGDNLVSPRMNSNRQYRIAQKEVEPGLYVQTLSSTEEKLRTIRQISDSLRLGLKASLVDF